MTKYFGMGVVYACFLSSKMPQKLWAVGSGAYIAPQIPSYCGGVAIPLPKNSVPRSLSCVPRVSARYDTTRYCVFNVQ